MIARRTITIAAAAMTRTVSARWSSVLHVLEVVAVGVAAAVTVSLAQRLVLPMSGVNLHPCWSVHFALLGLSCCGFGVFVVVSE